VNYARRGGIAEPAVAIDRVVVGISGGATNFGNGNIVNVDCLTGTSFLHPIDAHRPRTMQLGLRYSF